LKTRSWVVALVAAALSCARMAAPGGGPEDRTPPELVSVKPEPGGGYGDLETVILTWSERLDEASAVAFIYPVVDFDTKISGSEIKIHLAEPPGEWPLVIHIPGTLRDRRGNETGIPLELAYTSMDSLPAGMIRISPGRQGGGSLSESTLLEVFDDDSTLVRRTEPDSAMSLSSRWLLPGVYRVLCYEDTDGSMTWEAESEAGFDTTVSLPDGDTLFLSVTLTVVDTVGPRLVDVSALDGYHLELEFNEDVSYESFIRGEAVVRDSLGNRVPVRGAWLSEGVASRNVILETGKMSDKKFLFLLSGVRDLMDNPSRPDSMEFFGMDSIPADTFRVRSHYPAGGTSNADPAGPFLISFNYWVDPDSLEKKWTLTCVADSTLVHGTLVVVDGRSFEFYPEHQLIGEQQYRFLLEPGLATQWGDTLSEPVSWSFSTLWGDEPGSISGVVNGGVGSPVYLMVRMTGGASESRVTYFRVERGPYRLEEIPAGRYTVAAFVDRDGGGTWSVGEPYGTFPGVVLVRPGLSADGVDIEILP